MRIAFKTGAISRLWKRFLQLILLEQWLTDVTAVTDIVNLLSELPNARIQKLNTSTAT